jgi:hypothetical protein
MKWVLPIVALLIVRTALAEGESTIYDADPHHLWNRLNETLFLRTAADGKGFGLDELDILYWHSTRHLLEGPSRQKAVDVLDEFISTHGERLVHDPVKRAWLQRDLWELFDWSASPYREADHARASRELQSRLAVVIRRVALTTKEIQSLPDNYERSATEHLPRGLLKTNGDWICVRDQNDARTAPSHVSSLGGRSAFTVHLRVPGGRSADEDYLGSLRAFGRTNHLWVYHTNRFTWMSTNEPVDVLELNLAIPQFPTNTEWALVRRMELIDADGNLQPTRLVESIQLRHYIDFQRAPVRVVTNQNGTVAAVPVPRQDFYEFQFNRRDGGRLREIGKHERGFPFVHFQGKGIDLFEAEMMRSGRNADTGHDSSPVTSVILDTCMQCHSSRGIFSVNSYTRALSASARGPANFAEDVSSHDQTEAIYWKQRQYDWGLLQGLWTVGYGQGTTEAPR